MYSTPEKSTGMETVAGGGGGAGLVVSAGCWADIAKGRASKPSAAIMVVFIELLRRACQRYVWSSICSEAAQPWKRGAEHNRATLLSSLRPCRPSAGSSRAWHP